MLPNATGDMPSSGRAWRLNPATFASASFDRKASVPGGSSATDAVSSLVRQSFDVMGVLVPSGVASRVTHI